MSDETIMVKIRGLSKRFGRTRVSSIIWISSSASAYSSCTKLSVCLLLRSICRWPICSWAMTRIQEAS
jgi:hypothetical protein